MKTYSELVTQWKKLKNEVLPNAKKKLEEDKKKLANLTATLNKLKNELATLTAQIKLEVKPEVTKPPAPPTVTPVVPAPTVVPFAPEVAIKKKFPAWGYLAIFGGIAGAVGIGIAKLRKK